MTAHRWQPFGLDPLIAEAKLRMRRRRLVITLMLAAAALAVGLALAPRPASRIGLPSGAGRVSFIGDARVGGLELSIPAGFEHEVTTFGTVCRRHCQVTLSNGRLPFIDRPPNAWAISAIDKPLPSDRVALVVNVWLGTSCEGAGLGPCVPNLRLPASLSQLEPRPSNVSSGTRRVNVFQKRGAGGGLYEIGIWIGRNAPQSDKDAVVAALRSIRVATK